MKKTITAAAAAALSVCMAMTAFAGWQQDQGGWWYQNDDGSWPAAAWQWIDGNGDGVAECYYFDGNGYLLSDTQTPDGYLVNADGAWLVDGVVQTQGAAQTAAGQDASDTAYRQAYAAFLRDYANGSETEPHFALAYLDGDDCPELMVADNPLYFSRAKWTACTYYDGQVKVIGEYGSGADMDYVPKGNYIHSKTWGSGDEVHRFYQIENGAERQIAEYATSFRPGYEFTKDGTPVSESAYNAGLTQAMNQNFVNLKYENGYPITEANIQAQLGS